MGRKKNNRQYQIALEMGLVGNRPVPQRAPEPPPVPVDGRRVHCPCGRDGHRTNDGYCIDGKLYTNGEIFALKQVELHGKGLARKVLSNPAIRLLDDTLGLDFSLVSVKLMR